MTLHKLWTKMCEKDWRTITKSVFILHSISRDCQADSCRKFAQAIKDMSKARNPKNPSHRYFDQRMVQEVDELSEDYEPFVTAYAAYVVARSRTFSAKFDELKELSSSTTEKKAVATLKKAQGLIQAALQCNLDGCSRTMFNYITGQAIRHVALDLKDLWKLFSTRLGPLVGEGQPYDNSKPAASEDIAALLEFYRSLETDIRTFLQNASGVLVPKRIKLPADIDSKFSVRKYVNI